MGILEHHHPREHFHLDWLGRCFLAKFHQPIHMTHHGLEKTQSLEVVLVAIQMYQCGTVMISVGSHLAYLFRHEFQRQWSPFNIMTLQKNVDFHSKSNTCSRLGNGCSRLGDAEGVGTPGVRVDEAVVKTEVRVV
jgi:hypothetical protein